MTILRLFILGILLRPIAGAAGNKPLTIHLKVELNGHVVPGPDRVQLTVGKDRVDVPVRNDRFQVPARFAHASTINFSTVVGNNRISADIIHQDLAQEIWTLVLADHQFPNEYRFVVKNSDARSSCIIVFDSSKNEGDWAFYPNCRSKAASHNRDE